MLEIHQARREAIAAEVRAAMARRRETIDRLAPVISVTRSTLSRKLNGHTSFTADELLAIADHLEIQPAVLLSGAA